MNDSVIAITVIIVFCIFLVVASFFAVRVQKKKAAQAEVSGSESYLMASRSFGVVLVAVTTIGFAIGANTTTGIAQLAYNLGFSGGWYGYAFVIGLIFTAFVFAKRFRSSGFNTITQVYGDCYGDDCRIISSIGQLFMNFTLMVAQFVGGGSILSTVLPEYFTFTTGVIVSMVIFTIICLAGGMISAGVTNLINIGIIYIAVITCTILGVNAVGGWNNMTATLPAHNFSIIGNYGWAGAIAYILLFLVNVPTSQSAIQMILSAKDEKTAKKGYCIGGILLLPIAICCAIIGMVAAMMFPGLEETATALPKVAFSFGGLTAGLVLAGMWAAIISTATTMIVANSLLIMNDLVKPIFKVKFSSQKKEILWGRIFIVICSLLVCYFALYQRQILNTVTVGLAVSVGFFYVLVITWWMPKLARKCTGNVLIATSFICSVLWFIVPWFSTVLPHVLYLHLICCTIAFFFTLLDKRPAFFQTPGYKEKFGHEYKG